MVQTVLLQWCCLDTNMNNVITTILHASILSVLESRSQFVKHWMFFRYVYFAVFDYSRNSRSITITLLVVKALPNMGKRINTVGPDAQLFNSYFVMIEKNATQIELFIAKSLTGYSNTPAKCGEVGCSLQLDAFAAIRHRGLQAPCIVIKYAETFRTIQQQS